MNNMAMKIKQWRIKHHLEQDEMARRIGFSTRALQTWERGERLPGSEALRALADCMGVSTDWLLGRTQDQNERDQG